jgi:hypothetical protein
LGQIGTIFLALSANLATEGNDLWITQAKRLTLCSVQIS